MQTLQGHRQDKPLRQSEILSCDAIIPKDENAGAGTSVCVIENLYSCMVVEWKTFALRLQSSQADIRELAKRKRNDNEVGRNFMEFCNFAGKI